MKVKVCGLKEPENIEALAQLPIDFMGFIFYRKSPRFVGEDLANWLAANEAKLEGIERVGVFVNAEIEEILNRVHDFELDYVQLHGNESPEYCREIKLLWEASSARSARFIKAFPVDADFDFAETQAYEGICSLFLFDTKTPKHGGSGVSFDWNLLTQYKGNTPFLLSGGIEEGDADAIKRLDFPQLYGVDVNSRFEIEPGLKDKEKVKRFISVLEN
jgi:phosphoribosylanthranilate isomerase